MLKDLRHAVRVLLHAKGWTVVVLLSLALGIGANTAIFTALNAMLLKQIPVRDPDTLVRLRWYGKNDMVTSSSDYGFTARGPNNENVRTTFSYPMFQQFVADNKTMTDVIACAPYSRVTVVVDGQAEVATAFISTGNYYRALGVGARIGRTILPEDDVATAAPVAMISSKYWHTRFATDPGVVGSTIRVNNVVLTIVGVIEPGFTGIQQPLAELPDISLPLALDPQLDTGSNQTPRLSQPTYWWLQVMGRLKPGATAAQVQGNLEGVFQQTAQAGLDVVLEIADRRAAEHSVKPEPERDPAAAGRVRRARHLRREHERTPLRHDPDGGRRPRAPDRVRERGQPAAVESDDAPEGTVGADVAWRDADAPDPSVADRKPAARRDRWRARAVGWLLGASAATRRLRAGTATRRSRPRLHSARHTSPPASSSALLPRCVRLAATSARP